MSVALLLQQLESHHSAIRKTVRHLEGVHNPYTDSILVASREWDKATLRLINAVREKLQTPT